MSRNYHNISWIIVFLCWTAISCQNKVAGKQGLIDYLNNPDHGLLKINSAGQVKLALQFRPWQIMYSRKNSRASVNKKMSSFYKSKLCFVLKISEGGKELLRQLPFNQYSDLVQVLAFRMNEFIKIIPDDKYPMQPDECLFDQTYGLSDANELLIIVDKHRLEDARTLTFIVKEFGLGTGDQQFEIKTRDMENIPPII